MTQLQNAKLVINEINRMFKLKKKIDWNRNWDDDISDQENYCLYLNSNEYSWEWTPESNLIKCTDSSQETDWYEFIKETARCVCDGEYGTTGLSRENYSQLAALAERAEKQGRPVKKTGLKLSKVR